VALTPSALDTAGPTQPDSDDDNTSTSSYISTAEDIQVPDSDDDLEVNAADISDNVDPSYLDDINSELQDQGIGVAKDAFSMDVQIISHSLRNGKLTLKAQLGKALAPVSVDWEELKVDVPATLANYILTKRVGANATDPGSRAPYQWAKGFLPNLRRAMIQLEQSYGVVTPGLSKLRRMVIRRHAAKQVAPKQIGPKPKKSKSNSPNRRKGKGNSMGTIKYGVLIPRTTEEAYEHDQKNGDNLWGDAMFDEVQTQVDYRTYQFLEPGAEPPEGYQEANCRMIFDIKQDL
jgi:hypothetical protein